MYSKKQVWGFKKHCDKKKNQKKRKKKDARGKRKGKKVMNVLKEKV